MLDYFNDDFEITGTYIPWYIYLYKTSDDDDDDDDM